MNSKLHCHRYICQSAALNSKENVYFSRAQCLLMLRLTLLELISIKSQYYGIL